jgi:GNAT superfamily N-acetyltransferase
MRIHSNATNCLIREMLPSDIDKLIRMVGKLAAFHGDTPELTESNLVRDVFAESPWIYILVAEAEGELIGYAAMCGLIKLHYGDRGLDIHHLFVEEEIRGRGVGKKLVAACVLKAQELLCGYLAVGTNADNLQAQAFYVELGFNRRNSFPPRFMLRIKEAL